MPQQIHTVDYLGAGNNIAQSFGNAASGAIQGGVAGYQAGVTANKNAAIADRKLAAFEQLKTYYSPYVETDWDKLSPSADESEEQYSTRLKQELVPIIDQLEKKGVNPTEMQKVLTVPSLGFDTFKKFMDKRTGQLLNKDLMSGMSVQPSEAALADIRAGVLSLDQINAKHRTNVSQGDYEKIAGLQPVASVGPQGPIPKNIALQAATPMQDKDALAVPGVMSAPLSYEQAYSKVSGADLPSEQKKDFAPILTNYANREAAKVVSDNPKVSDTQFMGGLMEGGVPLTDESKLLFQGLQKDERIDIDKLKAKRMSIQQDNIMLREMMKDKRFKDTMRAKYGDKADEASEYMAKLHLDLENLHEELTWADAINPTVWMARNPTKKLPNSAAILNKIAATESEISRIKSMVPGLQSIEDTYRYNPTILQPPVVEGAADLSAGASSKATSSENVSTGVTSKTSKRKPLAAFER
jgi:hypothetical protein